MSQLQAISQELNHLQKEMQQTVNQTGRARHWLDQALRSGHNSGDFLSRRLIALKKESETRFNTLLAKFNFILSDKLDRALPSSAFDAKALNEIRTSIRYIRNAFAGEIPLTQTLDTLKMIEGNASKKRAENFRIL